VGRARESDRFTPPAGPRQKPGQPRLELAGANGAILGKLRPNGPKPTANVSAKSTTKENERSCLFL